MNLAHKIRRFHINRAQALSDRLRHKLHMARKEFHGAPVWSRAELYVSRIADLSSRLALVDSIQHLWEQTKSIKSTSWLEERDQRTNREQTK